VANLKMQFQHFSGETRKPHDTSV